MFCSISTDTETMKVDVIIPVVQKVLANPLVLITAAVIIFYLNFVFFVARYRKRPSTPKVKKAAPAPAPAPAPVKDSGDEE